MRVLSVVRRGYYGSRRAVEPMYLYFTQPLALLGHEVEHFDHVRESATHGVERATSLLQDALAEPWDLVLYQHAPTPEEPVDTGIFRAVRDRVCVIAWNSDDDWQWSRTSRSADHFTWMVTTYPEVHTAHREQVPNLLLSQWGCLGTYAQPGTSKDIDFSFAGSVYRSRVDECRHLRRRSHLRAYGRGARLVTLPIPNVRGLGLVPFLGGPPLPFEAINDVWNRTKVSFTPLSGGPSGEVKSIKSRIFDMGLSGTVALTEAAPHLERYYDPGTEVVLYEDLDDCAAHVERLLRDERLRKRIALAYRRRTLGDHLWTRRFTELFVAAGLT